MPMGRIEIEEIGVGRWVAEIEAGRQSRRHVVRAATVEEAIDAAYAAYRELVPQDKAPEPAGQEQKVDPALFPPKPAAASNDDPNLSWKAPVGKVRAQRMRRNGHAA